MHIGWCIGSKQPQRQPVEAVSAWQVGESGLRWNQEDHDRPYRPNDDGSNTGHARPPPPRHIRMLRSAISYEGVRVSPRPSVRPIPPHVWRWGACGELPAGAQADGGRPAGHSDLPGPLRSCPGPGSRWRDHRSDADQRFPRDPHRLLGHASPAPTDYRLRWASAESDYLSWTADDETDRGNAYPAGDATSLTLSGLSEGTEFKVQVRAQYNDGAYKDEPQSGDWAEARGRVMSQPAPGEAQFLGARLLGARGAQHPGNFGEPRGPRLAVVAGPLGRLGHRLPGPAGPDAHSLVVIEQDTGSSGTSYTDTAPPAGQTNTYAVKARNSTGQHGHGDGAGVRD